MSITQVLTSPPIWSPSYNPILWEVRSDQVGQFKFKYVFDVYIGGATGPLRYKVPPNPQGVGIINVQSLCESQLSITENLPFLSPTPFYNGQGMATEVYILAGEEYATSPDGATQIYNGSGFVGTPAFGLYANSNFNPAPTTTDPVVAFASGQDAQTYYRYQSVVGEDIEAYIMDSPTSKFLRNEPNNPSEIRSDESVTLSWLNWDFLAATGPRAVPYAMKTTVQQNGVEIGERITLNTVANGGQWGATGSWNNPSAATGPTSSAFYLNNFKQVLPLTNLELTQDYWFDENTGCGFDALGQVFPGYLDVGLTPASAFQINNGSQGRLQPENQSDCSGGISIGTTGYSDLVYRSMQIESGAMINIKIPSTNSWGVQHPEMYLWGSTGTPTVGANWEEITVFNATESSTSTTDYTITNYTTTKVYTALGIRFKSISTLEPCGNYGCFSDYWNITVQNPDYDEVCFQLFPYETYGQSALGATGISEKVCYKINDDNCWGFEPIRITWLNAKGGRDWYTFIKRNTFTQNASRDQFYQLPAYWSGNGFSIQDINPSRYGTTVFNVNLEQVWTASTDWLSEEDSAWLRDLFKSPSVHAYLPGYDQPTLVSISDVSYSVETFARQKLFQYFVSFVEAQPDTVQSY
jgi:hypothetical protein